MEKMRIVGQISTIEEAKEIELITMIFVVEKRMKELNLEKTK